MTCDEARGAFSDLYDDALSGAALVTITQHLATCPACRAEWASFRNAMQAVSDLGGAEPSPGFADRVRLRADEPSWSDRVVRWLFVPLGVKVPIQAVALALLAFAGLLLYQRSPELRRGVESQSAEPLVAREAPAAKPAPAVPPPAEEPPKKTASVKPQQEAPKSVRTERQAPPTEKFPTPPQARLKAGKDGAAADLRDEAKEAGKAAEPSRDFRPKTGEPGAAGRRLLQSAPPQAEPGRALAPAPPPVTSPAPAPSAPAVEKEIPSVSTVGKSADERFSAAVADLERQRYDQAIDGLRAFIAEHPRDARVPGARLRLADAYMAQQRHREAIAEYEAVAREFPNSPIIPSALYRQAQSRLALGDRAGCQLLRDVTDHYPQAPEADLAREVLSTRCP
jgi:TolA-binding protein